MLGENGAGKTTLMNILAGRLRPDAGSIELFGRALRPGAAAAALAAGVAAVHQSPMLFERMTWEENLALGGFGAGAARTARTGSHDRLAGNRGACRRDGGAAGLRAAGAGSADGAALDG